LWAIRIIGSKELVGTICLWNFSKDEVCADIGFVLHPDQQRKGIMSEALQKVLEFGFSDLSLNTIYGEVDPLNIPSIKLMEKYDFKLATKNEETVIYKLTRTNNIN
jgi:ribosomal-protein-alanine N-acetyltransferase